ncbi:hypothetical protein LSAT2_020771 [Lamellibrachia satsuma]|nr:hypothetical protein LSAT2_020771 [Lamellibrachia satsuma]
MVGKGCLKSLLYKKLLYKSWGRSRRVILFATLLTSAATSRHDHAELLYSVSVANTGSATLRRLYIPYQK